MRSFGLVLLLVVAAALPFSGQADDGLSTEDVLAAFDQAALGPADREGAQLYRWQKDVSVRFVGQTTSRQQAWAEAQLAEFEAATGQTVQRIDSIGADVLVVFVASFDDVLDGQYNDLLDRFALNDARRDQLLEGYRQSEAVCAGQINARGNGLSGGIVFIPTDQLSPVVHACIAAQMSRVMGLPFAVDANVRSALASDSPHSHLTRLDRVMLRLLYDPRMKSGMSRRNALTIARSVLPSVMGQVQ